MIEEVFAPVYTPTTRIVRQPRSSSVSLSKCGLKYALAIADPFNPAATGACVPVAGGPPTQKCRSFVRFDVIAGAGPVYIGVSPCLANDMPTIIAYSAPLANGAYVPYTANNTPSGSTTTVTVNTPYTTNQLTQGFGNGNEILGGRVVAAGLRAQYSGDTTAQSGMVYCLHSSTHDNLALADSQPNTTLGNTIVNISGHSETDVTPVSRQPCMLSIFGVSTREYQMATVDAAANGPALAVSPFCQGDTIFAGGFTNTISGVLAGAPIAIIAINGLTAGRSYHFEYVQHCEYSGFGAEAFVVPNEAAPEDIAIVCSAAQMMGRTKMSMPSLSPWAVMRECLGVAAKVVAKVAVPMMETALMALLI